MTTKPRYDVFLSHSSADKSAVEALAGKLKDAGVEPFFGAWHLTPGKLWQKELMRALSQSATCAVFLGPSGIGPWEDLELQAALARRAKTEGIIPVLLPGAEEPAGEDAPAFLELFTWVRFRDIEDQSAFHRLLAGIRGQPPGPPAERYEVRHEAVPEPKYASDEVRELSLALEESWRRHEELTIAGEDPSAVLGEILSLKRQLREGPELKAGDILGEGRFRLLESLGRGGFATVWKAFDRKRRRVVAVKVLHGQYAEDRTRRERFFRGARKMAETEHPGIVRVLEEQCEDGGYHYFVMEYLEGGDLRQAVLTGRLVGEAALAKVLEVGEALGYAHERGLVHRDVKPANILLDGEGRPKLTDFDLVRGLDTTGGTRTAAILGTILYSAPEGLASAREAGVAADVYSLGMTAVFALHGAELPLDVLRQGEKVIGALSCHAMVKRALVQATAWEVEDRFGNVAEFLAALRAKSEEREPAPVEPTPKPPKKRGKQPHPAVDLVHWVEKEVPELPAGKRPGAVLDRVASAPPLRPGDLKHVGVLAWVLDYFPGRSGVDQECEEAGRLREQLLAPLRERHPPPAVPGEGWVRISAGSFQMGSKSGGPGDERPAHEVTLSLAFWMLDHPVTNREHRLLVPGRKGDDDLPAVNVTWYEAYAHAAWLGGRLPTEAEWEYACRAGTTTAWWSGESEEDLARVGWYKGNSGGRLHEVKEFYPNPWGLYDMHGNVWEWVADWWDPEWYGKPEASRPDPWGPPSGVRRVFRGGSFGDGAGNARSAFRDWDVPRVRWGIRGFRVVVPVAPSPRPSKVVYGPEQARRRR